nr:MAG TPA: metalloprotease [Caudoviricetes sp.]
MAAHGLGHSFPAIHHFIRLEVIVDCIATGRAYGNGVRMCGIDVENAIRVTTVQSAFIAANT